MDLAPEFVVDGEQNGRVASPNLLLTFDKECRRRMGLETRET